MDNIFVERLWRTVKYESLFKAAQQHAGLVDGIDAVLPIL
jgi:hypothetical protein